MKQHDISVSHHHWLTKHAFEVRFRRPNSFDFFAGQKIRITYQSVTRDYSLINAPQDKYLAICVRHIPDGTVSPVLAEAEAGQRFQVSEAFGYYTYQPSDRPSVFVATGTGIAPFVSYVRSGAKQFYLLHGVRLVGDLYYRDIVSPAAKSYTACVSQMTPGIDTADRIFSGRVTHYLQNQLPAGDYDFYLCGRSEMMRDAMAVIDRRFEGSRVYTETFF